MIQSPAPLSQVGGRTRFFMEHEHEQEGANYDHSHGPACLTLSSQNFIPGDSSATGNYIEFGGSSSCCAGLEFYDSQGKAEMISVDWESPMTRSEEFPSGRQGSPDRNWLSMGNGLDKTADREFVAGNEMQYNQNSPTSFKPEPFVQLSMRSGSFNEESETRTGSQQITQSVDNAPPNHCNSSPLSDGDQSQPLSPASIVRQEDRVRSHNFPASCVDNTDIDLPSRVEDPVLSLTAFPVQRSTAREPWINRSNRLNEVHEQDHDKKRWAPLKKTARKNNMSAMTTCKDPAKETNNYDHNIVGTRNGTAGRACVDCYTTKTPLWRSGPHGPKSLCNACGIRYRKTRRAALSECINGKTAGSPKRKTEENLIHFKKRSRVSMASCKKNIGLGNHSPFQRVFAQDEEEAAVLLMALSCGLVHG